MKRTLPAFFFIICANIFLVTQSALAVDYNAELKKTGAASNFGSNTDLVVIIGNVINYALAFLGLIMLVIFIYAGFLYMTAGGVEDKTKKAKAWMKNGVIGLVIILLSYGISSFVINAITEVTT